MRNRKPKLRLRFLVPIRNKGRIFDYLLLLYSLVDKTSPYSRCLCGQWWWLLLYYLLILLHCAKKFSFDQRNFLNNIGNWYWNGCRFRPLGILHRPSKSFLRCQNRPPNSEIAHLVGDIAHFENLWFKQW